MTVSRLGGFPLLASSPVRWVLREGVAWHEETFDLIPGDADSLLALARAPVSLVIDNQAGRVLEYKKLWVVDRIPGDNPHIAKVRVVDRRFWLPYFNFLGRFNMRRNIGAKRVGSLLAEQLNPVVPSIWYWPWSLKIPNGNPPGALWKASDVLEEFMAQLEKWEGDNRPGSGGHDIPPALKDADKKINVDNLNIDDSGETALLRVLTMYPNAGVYVSKEGDYTFFDRNDHGEDAAVKDLGPVLVGAGQFMKVENKLIRPKQVDVYFTMEVEIRHDFIGGNATMVEDQRALENVATVPDFTATIGGVDHPQGSWVNIDALLRATQWATHPGAGGGPITQRMIEKAAMPYLDLWGAMMITGVRDPDSNWCARVATLQQHWRRSFRITPTWMSRTLSLKARRCALIDPSTGTWAPSVVCCNHSFLGTVRSFFKSLRSGGGAATMEYAINIEGYPDIVSSVDGTEGGQVPGISSPSGAMKFLEESKAAPVIVRVVDGDQGILMFDFQAEKNHIYEACLPGRIVREDGTAYTPTADWRNPKGAAVTFDMVTSRAQVPRLESDWKAAVIVSHVPASPNNKRQLYKITVKPDEIKDRIPGGIGPAFGPTWEVRVGPGMDGAKALVRWDDDRAEDIEAIFGIGGKEPKLAGLVVNHDTQASLKQEAISLSEVAASVAAQIYSRFVDHQEGSGTGYLNPNIVPTGWIAHVAHVLSPRGELMTEIRMKDAIQELNLLSLFDNSTRGILMKLPHVDRQ